MIERKEYPDRYYASYDKTNYVVTGWYDTWEMSSVTNVPSAGDMVVVTPAQWNDTTSFRLPTGKGVIGSKIVDYTPPATPIPLTTQAETAMTWVQDQATMASAMGETFTADMKAYVATLRAIISGDDSTSTELPERPNDIMV
ncbi:hypothetical protein KBX73_15025 [Acetobacter persici]|uniref:hypothetical protein n=1 Tax=Acetobacter persici TaxID=1076596 RepID=UPI001BA5FE63|nr:hypothetical protein [Acetobacter persici]MBS1017255.1 hypothetical protein [Acetobacter persici]MCP9321052.1 hypothetical protein [Acetobacter persici]